MKAKRDDGGPMKHPNMQSFCVYMTMIGKYEQLNDQPVASSSDIPFVCLTDDPDLTSDTWQIRLVSPTFGMDPIRSQRDLKLRPHVHLPDFEGSLYIDNTVILKEPPEKIVERYWSSSGFSVAFHSFRETVFDEFIEVSRLGLDDQGRIYEQLNHYQKESPEVLLEKPFWGGILLRDHTAPAVRNMLEIWNAHVQRYARRDQLSMNYAFRKAELEPEVMHVDNYNSWFHSRSLHNNRDQENDIRRPLTSMPQEGRLRELETTIAQQRDTLTEQARLHAENLAAQARQFDSMISVNLSRLNAMEASKGWRAATFLGRIASRFPRVAAFLWHNFEQFEKRGKSHKN